MKDLQITKGEWGCAVFQPSQESGQLLEALEFLVERVEKQSNNRFSVRVVALEKANQAIKTAKS